jgi:hypothetical protein
MLANTLTLDDEDAVQEELASLQRELVCRLPLYMCLFIIPNSDAGTGTRTGPCTSFSTGQRARVPHAGGR